MVADRGLQLLPDQPGHQGGVGGPPAEVELQGAEGLSVQADQHESASVPAAVRPHRGVDQRHRLGELDVEDSCGGLHGRWGTFRHVSERLLRLPRARPLSALRGLP